VIKIFRKSIEQLKHNCKSNQKASILSSQKINKIIFMIPDTRWAGRWVSRKAYLRFG